MRVNVIGFEISQGISKTTQKPYAIGKLHVILPISNGAFSEREGNVAKGAMGHTYAIGVEHLAKIRHLTPPLVCEAFQEDVMRFGEVKQEIVSLVPVERPPEAAGKAVAKV